MVVLSNKILFLILLKFILRKKVLNQSLTVEPPRPNNDSNQFQNELNKNLKKRMSDFGSLKPQKANEEPTNNPNSEDSYLEQTVRPTRTQSTTHGTRSASNTYPGAYQPPQRGDYLSANFEEFLTKQNREYLERCTVTPHEFVLVIDESGSISSYNWGTIVKDFVNLVTTAIAQLNADNNLSIVQYSHKPKMIMEPRKLNKETLPAALKVVKHMFDAKRTYGTTNTGLALEFVRDQVLDPKGQFVTELSEGVTPLNKKNMIVILMTDGASKDHEKAMQEALIQRFNGVDLFVFGIGSVNESECRKFVGCPMTGECSNFLHAEWNTVLEYLYKLIQSVCKDTGRNATCLDTWSEYTECSVPCGGGTKTSKLLKLTTLTEPTTGLDGVKGLTCEEQFKGVTERVKPCNQFPCLDKLVNIHKHTPVEETVVASKAMPTNLGRAKEETQEDQTDKGNAEEDNTDDADNADEDDEDDEEVEEDQEEHEEEQEEETETEIKSTVEQPEPESLQTRRSEPEPLLRSESQPLQGGRRSERTESPLLNERTDVPESRKSVLSEDTSQLSQALRTLENRGKTTDQDLTQNTLTTEPEVRPRTVTRLESTRPQERPRESFETLVKKSHIGDALRELVDQGPETTHSVPFQVVGGPEHRNLHVERVLTDSETQTPNEEPRTVPEATTKAEKSTETDPEPETETEQESAETQTESEESVTRVVETTERSTQTPAQETVHRHTPTTNVADEPRRHTVATQNQNHPRHTTEEHTLKLPNLQHVQAFTKTFKQRFMEFLHGERVKKITAVLIVIFLTAVSLSVFSYIFLRDKEPTPHLFDPSDQEFMNAGDGDDVEPSENYQVSNMEDGIWA